MSMLSMYVLCCDQCFVKTHPQPDQDAALDAGHRHGWTVIGSGITDRHLCPTCGLFETVVKRWKQNPRGAAGSGAGA